MQITQWDFQDKEARTNPARLSFLLKVPLCNLRPSIIYSVPCDQLAQRADPQDVKFQSLPTAIAVSELTCASSLKRVLVRMRSHKLSLICHEIEPAGEPHFHINGFTRRPILTQREKRTRK